MRQDEVEEVGEVDGVEQTDKPEEDEAMFANASVKCGLWWSRVIISALAAACRLRKHSDQS